MVSFYFLLDPIHLGTFAEPHFLSLIYARDPWEGHHMTFLDVLEKLFSLLVDVQALCWELPLVTSRHSPSCCLTFCCWMFVWSSCWHPEPLQMSLLNSAESACCGDLLWSYAPQTKPKFTKKEPRVLTPSPSLWNQLRRWSPWFSRLLPVLSWLP